jgi:hypothetical protein
MKTNHDAVSRNFWMSFCTQKKSQDGNASALNNGIKIATM